LILGIKYNLMIDCNNGFRGREIDVGIVVVGSAALLTVFSGTVFSRKQ
jgi:hypothetical protein